MNQHLRTRFEVLGASGLGLAFRKLVCERHRALIPARNRSFRLENDGMDDAPLLRQVHLEPMEARQLVDLGIGRWACRARLLAYAKGDKAGARRGDGARDFVRLVEPFGMRTVGRKRIIDEEPDRLNGREALRDGNTTDQRGGDADLTNPSHRIAP